MTMKARAVVALGALVVFSGCASVEMADKTASAKAKEFNAPRQGQAGLYIYRDGFAGKAIKKDLWVDGKCLGEGASDVFFYTEVEGGKVHKIDTESEFSPNSLEMSFESGRNYFVRQFIKMGFLVGGTRVEPVTEDIGKKAVVGLEMARPGKCRTTQ